MQTNKEKIDPFDVMLMNHAVTIGIVEAVDLACITAHAFKEEGATAKAVREILTEIDNQALNFYLTDRRLEWREARAYAAEGKRKRNKKNIGEENEKI